MNTIIDFQPKWQSKTTKNRLLAIEQYAHSRFYGLEPLRIHRKHIAKGFGQAQNKLSKFFIDHLLQKTSEPIASVRPTEYHFSWSNLLFSFIQAGIVTSQEVGQIINPKYIPVSLKDINKYKVKVHAEGKNVKESLSVLVFQDDIKAKLFFDHRFFLISNLRDENAQYVEDKTTGRLISPFQQKPREVKAKYFAGMWDIDVEACFYTVFHQHMMNTVLPWWGKTDNKYPIMEMAYKQKASFRQTIANDLGVDVNAAKMILASLAFSCGWAFNHHSGINKSLIKSRFDPTEVYVKFKESKLLQGLIVELRKAWPKAMAYWNNHNDKIGRKIYFVEFISKHTGEVRRRFKPASFRAKIYFELERKVLDAMRCLYKDEICHLMHDGVIVKDEPNLDLISLEIKLKTGFNVKLSSDKF